MLVIITMEGQIWPKLSFSEPFPAVTLGVQLFLILAFVLDFFAVVHLSTWFVHGIDAHEQLCA